jgi:aminoglycoside phosphotransferase
LELMPHSYTNHTTRDGHVVTKAYQGPDAAGRRALEAAVLRGLAGRLPVPSVIRDGNARLQLSFMPGVHGQDLIAAGRADQVLRACGLMLRRVHAIDVRLLGTATAADPGTVLIHGDYGPNNVLLDPDAQEVTAVLDWEWTHTGDPVEDLAWCEWIVRMHHPGDVRSLDAFFHGYGACPAWPTRQRAMLARCHQMLELCQRWQRDAESVPLWEERLATTESWTAAWTGHT